LVERVLCKHEVSGSNPLSSKMFPRANAALECMYKKILERAAGALALIAIPIVFLIMFAQASPLFFEPLGRPRFFAFWIPVTLGYVCLAAWWWLRPKTAPIVVKVAVVGAQLFVLAWVVAVGLLCTDC
jgi:hypothetical protein